MTYIRLVRGVPRLARSAPVRLIRSRGHLPKEEYDGHDGGAQSTTDTTELH
jgi:hypothetical protein